jgi:GNAT superfamily N-acetyltransferase
MEFDHLVFRGRGNPDREMPVAPDGYCFEVWRPSFLPAAPSGAPRRTYEVWWWFHRLHVFHNRDYRVVLAWHHDVIAHRLALFPGYFRFPFMARDDLQIGDVWTDPAHRGRGLAAYGLRFAMNDVRRDGDRVFWYLTEATNTASIRTVERAGLSPFGKAARTRRLGARVLGQFVVRPDGEP